MTRHSGIDGFLAGIPGICEECFSDQKQFPHPDYYYCEHRKRLAIQVQGSCETFRHVEETRRSNRQ